MFAPLTVVLLLATAPTLAASNLPSLGSPVPARILKARIGRQTCDVGEHHRDPCAGVRIHHHGEQDRVRIAWDASTLKVTFLYSTTLFTDSELGAGGLGRIDASMAIQPFLGGFVSPDWCDTETDISGDDLWCAVMKPAPHHYGKVLGFVQSVYLPFAPGVEQPASRRTAMSHAPGRPRLRAE